MRTRKFLSLALALALVLSLTTIPAFAAAAESLSSVAVEEGTNSGLKITLSFDDFDGGDKKKATYVIAEAGTSDFDEAEGIAVEQDNAAALEVDNVEAPTADGEYKVFAVFGDVTDDMSGFTLPTESDSLWVVNGALYFDEDEAKAAREAAKFNASVQIPNDTEVDDDLTALFVTGLDTDTTIAIESGNSGGWLKIDNSSKKIQLAQAIDTTGASLSVTFTVTLSGESATTDTIAVEIVPIATTYKVTFNANDGGSTQQDVVVNDAASSYELPTNTFTAPDVSKEFKGWSTADTVDEDNPLLAAGASVTLDADTTFYAIWGDKTNEKTPVLSISNVKADGNDVTLNGTTYTVAPGVEIKATYKLADYTVTDGIWFKTSYKLGSADAEEIKSAKLNSSEVTALTTDGLEAIFSTAGLGAGEYTIISAVYSDSEYENQIGAAVTIVLEIETAAPTTYTVTFKANGGTGVDVVVVDAESEYTLPANTFTASTGKVFTGWSTAAAVDETHPLLSAGGTTTLTGNTTFYAIWGDIGTAALSIASVKDGTEDVPLADGKYTVALGTEITATYKLANSNATGIWFHTTYKIGNGEAQDIKKAQLNSEEVTALKGNNGLAAVFSTEGLTAGEYTIDSAVYSDSAYTTEVAKASIVLVIAEDEPIYTNDGYLTSLKTGSATLKPNEFVAAASAPATFPLAKIGPQASGGFVGTAATGHSVKVVTVANSKGSKDYTKTADIAKIKFAIGDKVTVTTQTDATTTPEAAAKDDSIKYYFQIAAVECAAVDIKLDIVAEKLVEFTPAVANNKIFYRVTAGKGSFPDAIKAGTWKELAAPYDLSKLLKTETILEIAEGSAAPAKDDVAQTIFYIGVRPGRTDKVELDTFGTAGDFEVSAKLKGQKQGYEWKIGAASGDWTVLTDASPALEVPLGLTAMELWVRSAVKGLADGTTVVTASQTTKAATTVAPGGPTSKVKLPAVTKPPVAKIDYVKSNIKLSDKFEIADSSSSTGWTALSKDPYDIVREVKNAAKEFAVGDSITIRTAASGKKPPSPAVSFEINDSTMINLGFLTISEDSFGMDGKKLVAISGLPQVEFLDGTKWKKGVPKLSNELSVGDTQIRVQGNKDYSFFAGDIYTLSVTAGVISLKGSGVSVSFTNVEGPAAGQATLTAALTGVESPTGVTYAWTTTDGTIVSGANTESCVVSAAGVYTVAVNYSVGGVAQTEVKKSAKVYATDLKEDNGSEEPLAYKAKTPGSLTISNVTDSEAKTLAYTVSGSLAYADNDIGAISSDFSANGAEIVAANGKPNPVFAKTTQFTVFNFDLYELLTALNATTGNITIVQTNETLKNGVIYPVADKEGETNGTTGVKTKTYDASAIPDGATFNILLIKNNTPAKLEIYSGNTAEAANLLLTISVDTSGLTVEGATETPETESALVKSAYSLGDNFKVTETSSGAIRLKGEVTVGAVDSTLTNLAIADFYADTSGGAQSPNLVKADGAMDTTQYPEYVICALDLNDFLTAYDDSTDPITIKQTNGALDVYENYPNISKSNETFVKNKFGYAKTDFQPENVLLFIVKEGCTDIEFEISYGSEKITYTIINELTFASAS